MEARVLEEPQARSVAEELLMWAISLEPTGGLSHEDKSRTRRENIIGENDQEPSWLLK
jgi:hypothetical protein